MKHLFNLILVIAACNLFSCEKGKSDISGTYQLIEHIPVSVSKGQQTLAITASNLYDSRCPVNVTCIWEGYASVDFLVKSNETEKTIKICTGGCNLMKLPKEETLTFNGINYQIILKDIMVSSTSNQKTVIIVLVKK